MASQDENGDFTIYINNTYNAEQQREIYEHELRHVLMGHHSQSRRPLASLEAEAKGAPRLTLPAPPAPSPPAAPAQPPASSQARRLRRQRLTGMYY